MKKEDYEMEISRRRAIKSTFEAMMFVLGEPLLAKDAAEVVEINKDEAYEIFLELKSEYEKEKRGIQIREINGSFQFITDKDQEVFIRKLCTPVKVKRLSQAALEVLAIIAYRQPVTRGEIDQIRGIKCDRVLEGLIDKGLIEISGRSEGIGRPLLYSTTDLFLKKFGFSSIKDLPNIEQFDDNSEISNPEEAYAQLNIDFYEGSIDENK